MAHEFPYFPCYADDFTAGTAAMSPLAVGIYMRCLCHQWSHGSVPDDLEAIGRLSGATPDEILKAWPSVSSKFKKQPDGTLQNARMEKERAQVVTQSKRRTKAGKKGAKARWQSHSDGNADAMAKGMRTECDLDGKTMARTFGSGSGYGSGFELFWKVVPHKVGKGHAEKAYAKAIEFFRRDRPDVDPDKFLREQMALFAASPIGRGDPQFCPHPSTWLNAKRYDDDPATWLRRPSDPRGTLTAAQEYLSGK